MKTLKKRSHGLPDWCAACGTNCCTRDRRRQCGRLRHQKRAPPLRASPAPVQGRCSACLCVRADSTLCACLQLFIPSRLRNQPALNQLSLYRSYCTSLVAQTRPQTEILCLLCDAEFGKGGPRRGGRAAGGVPRGRRAGLPPIPVRFTPLCLLPHLLSACGRSQSGDRPAAQRRHCARLAHWRCSLEKAIDGYIIGGHTYRPFSSSLSVWQGRRLGAGAAADLLDSDWTSSRHNWH